MTFNMAAIVANGIVCIVVASLYNIHPYWYLIGFVILNALHIFFNIFVLSARPETKKLLLAYRWFYSYGVSIFIMCVSLASLGIAFKYLAELDATAPE